MIVTRSVGAEGFTRRVAIKRVLGGFMVSPDLGERLIAEARLSARLQHPNIVSVLDFDRDADGKFFLVMELVEGVSLDRLIGTGPPSPSAHGRVTVTGPPGLAIGPVAPAPAPDRRHRAWLAVVCGAVVASLVAGGFVRFAGTPTSARRRLDAGRPEEHAVGSGSVQGFRDRPHTTMSGEISDRSKPPLAAPAASGSSTDLGRSAVDAERRTTDRAHAPTSTLLPSSRHGGSMLPGAGSGSSAMLHVRLGE